jgi:type IV pilus assembly protein PilM
MSAITTIDIGSYALKALVGTGGAAPKIEKAIETFNPAGTTLPTDQQTLDGLVQLLTNTFNDYKLPKRDVRLSLPESAVSSKVITMPSLSDAELASAIQWQAEQHIPIALEELVLEYQVLYRPPRQHRDEQMRVLLVGTRRKVIDAFLDLFYQIGVEPTMVETNLLSTMRSLQFTSEDPTTFMVSVGASTTDMAVIDKGELAFVYTVPQGSQVLTKAISTTLQQDMKTSEEYKRRYGIDEAALGGKLREVIMPGVDLLVSELRKALQFFYSQQPQTQVSRIVLTGGGALLPGFVQYVASSLGQEVLLAAPFASATGQVPQNAGPQFSVAMGLLQRTNG